MYGKKYQGLPGGAALPSVSLANVGDTFEVQDLLFPMTSAGRGEATGVELFVERRFGDWYGQTNLCVLGTRHAALDGVLRPVRSTIRGW